MSTPPVQYTRTSDGLSIAFTVSGSGRPVVLMPWPMNHLQHVWAPGALRAYVQALSDRYRLVHYDARGMGLSARGLREDHSMAAYLVDLEAIVTHLELESFVLIGGPVSAYVAVNYAISRPGRVEALVIHNGTDGPPAELLHMFEGIARKDWEVFLESFAATTTPDRSNADFYRHAVDPADFLAMIRASRGARPLSALLPQLQTPTLVMNSRTAYAGGAMEASRRLASAIPNARHVLYGGPVHVNWVAEDATPPTIPLIESFLADFPHRESPPAGKHPLSTGPDVALLSARELEVLRLLAVGRSNRQIADDLVISLNTVRRHVSNIFDKTGVANRAQAAVYARDHGLA